jgi:hypothetical protein
MAAYHPSLQHVANAAILIGANVSHIMRSKAANSSPIAKVRDHALAGMSMGK